MSWISEVFHDAVLPSACHHTRFSIWVVQYELEELVQFSSCGNCGINPRISISRRVCKLLASLSSISKTIFFVRNSVVAHLKRASSHECCILTNSRRLDFFLQCFKPLKLFSQSVSRCCICFQMLHYHSLEFAPKNSHLAVSHF